MDVEIEKGAVAEQRRRPHAPSSCTRGWRGRLVAGGLLLTFAGTAVIDSALAHDPPDGPPPGDVEWTPTDITGPDGKTYPWMLAEGGDIGPLIPNHVTAVHSGLMWKQGAQSPHVLSFFRFPSTGPTTSRTTRSSRR